MPALLRSGTTVHPRVHGLLRLCRGDVVFAENIPVLGFNAAQSGGAHDKVATDVIAFITTMLTRGLVTLGET